MLRGEKYKYHERPDHIQYIDITVSKHSVGYIAGAIE